MQLKLDGSHAIAQKGGERVAYQRRKRAKTSHILPITAGRGDVVASTGMVAGNPHDGFNLNWHLQRAFKFMKRLALEIANPCFNADRAFDTRDARTVCFNHPVIANIAEHKPNRKQSKGGRKRLFNPEVYQRRFTSARRFAWIDQFRALLIRFDRKDTNLLGAHHLAFARITFRQLFATKG